MNLIDTIRNRIVDWLQLGADQEYKKQTDFIIRRREYRMGIQKRFIRVRSNQADDNLVVNYTGLLLNRSVSRLFDQGIEFEYGDASAQQTYIDGVYKANLKPILLHKMGMYGGESGMVFNKIVTGGLFTRLVPLDPAFMSIDTDPDDLDKVIRYTIQYKTVGLDGKEISKKETTDADNFAISIGADGQETIIATDNPVINSWIIRNYEAGVDTGGKWELIKQTLWNYDFPPIIHWQNMPQVGEIWGLPDITDDVIELQDRYNFIASNVSKVIRLFAHPQRWGKMLGEKKDITMGPDDMPSYNDPLAEVNQLPPLSDLPGATGFMEALRRSLFDITRTVDLSSFSDKLGALTNFGLHVLYQDELSKTNTKRELYGDGLKEINRRLLILANIEPVECELVWPNPLPGNEVEEQSILMKDQQAGIISQETLYDKRGYKDWEAEKTRIDDEQAANEQAQGDLGTFFLNKFTSNGGMKQNNNPAMKQKVR
jgi:hypothetical protein